MAWRFDLADVAHYQDEAGAPIDWDALAAGSPGSGGMTKATQRHNYVDPTLERHRSEMKRTQMRRRGLYHWLSPLVEASVAAQVANIRRAVGKFELGEFFGLDAEQSGVQEADAWELLNLVEDDTQRPSVVYGGIFTGGGAIWRSERIRISRFGPRCMWLAAYTTQEKLAAKLAALHIDTLPTHVNQWGSDGILADGSHVPGVRGRCDKNQINNFAVLDRCCGYGSQQEADMAERYYTVTGSQAKFIGTPARVRWTGPGSPKLDAAVAVQIAAGNLVPYALTGGPQAFGSAFLDGPLPVGDAEYSWTGDEFANTDQIKQVAAVTSDDTARALATAAQDELTKLREGLHAL